MDWSLFFSIFALIFIAELPDKTALATLTMATRAGHLPIFCGVALAFWIQCLVAVSFGKVFALLPEHWVHLASGLMFLGFAAHAAFYSSHEETDKEVEAPRSQRFWSVLWSSFVVIFIAEWGDLTQLATASLAARYPQALYTVFFSSFLALLSVTALAIFAGRLLQGWVSGQALHRVSIALFAVIGLYFVYAWFTVYWMAAA